ncbi:MAG: HD domain-containing protein [Thermodesulfobacteriota bacterium]|nr:HD domain-containing protein [Thermodesulfobacteriota bacterium]
MDKVDMIPKGGFISEMKQGDNVKAVFMVSEKKLLTTRNGRPFARLQLIDKTGEIPAMIWDDVKQKISGIELGSVVGVRGNVESYENRLQIRLNTVRSLDKDRVDISTLLPTTQRNISEMIKELDQVISHIRDKHLLRLVGNIFGRQELKKAFMNAPAAKTIHHNYVGGLLEHTLQVARSVISLFPIYSYMGMSQDLLLAGAILHDIGKIYEYSYDRVIDMTPFGRLVGHVYLSAYMVDKEISGLDDFPEELRIQLIHLILSHHGQLEFGSPKLPMTKEAMFLHMLDDLDAKLTGFDSIIEATPDDELFSSFSQIYNRYLYTRMYSEEEE